VVAGDEAVAQALQMLERETLAHAPEVVAEIGCHARRSYGRSCAVTARLCNESAQPV
jgi:hypothetical protein